MFKRIKFRFADRDGMKNTFYFINQNLKLLQILPQQWGIHKIWLALLQTQCTKQISSLSLFKNAQNRALFFLLCFLCLRALTAVTATIQCDFIHTPHGPFSFIYMTQWIQHSDQTNKTDYTQKLCRIIKLLYGTTYEWDLIAVGQNVMYDMARQTKWWCNGA